MKPLLSKILMQSMILGGFVGLLLGPLSLPVQAITQDLVWVGLGGHTIEGTFSYNDSLINTGLINETQLDTLMIDYSRYGTPIATWNLADGPGVGSDPFTFSFDTTTNTFPIGPGTQSWNFMGDPGLGFLSGDGDVLTVDGAFEVSYASGFTFPIQVGTLDQFTQSAFNFSWTGAGGYSIEGMFSYWDMFDDGNIEFGALTSFMMEGFLNGVSLGAYDLVADQLDGISGVPFEFSFDTTTNTFPIGPGTQSWNFMGDPGLGFLSGDGDVLTVDGAFEVSYASGFTFPITATPKNGTAPIPEPSTMLLFGTGLAGLAAWRWKRGTQA